MPWKEVRPMEERVRFVVRMLEGERMVDLCREYGISRKTGYKFVKRYESKGIEGLADEGRRPDYCPHRTPVAIEELVIGLRERRPTWGPKKLKAKLGQLHPGVGVPAASTIGEILRRYGCIEQRRRRRQRDYFPSERRESQGSNEVWCIDFKGEFRLGDGRYCYPLTVSDHYSRYLLVCEALESTKGRGVLGAMEGAFATYGLPQAIRSDNGSPFSSNSIGGLSKLSAWFMRLGIRPERIEAGHPEQNGRHERMHLTLKQETIRPAAANILAQQEAFDEFREQYNEERPHESLGMVPPAERYQTSCRSYPAVLPEPDYAMFDTVRTVQYNGCVRLPCSGDPYCFISQALYGQPVALRQLAEATWLLHFAGTDLGYISWSGKHFWVTVDPPLLAAGEVKVLPMCPV